LRALKREDNASRFVFMTERGAPMTLAGFRKLLAQLGVAAKFPFRCTRTCWATRQATSSPTTGVTRGYCSTTSGTRTDEHGALHRVVAGAGSRTFGMIEASAGCACFSRMGVLNRPFVNFGVGVFALNGRLVDGLLYPKSGYDFRSIVMVVRAQPVSRRSRLRLDPDPSEKFRIRWDHKGEKVGSRHR